MSKWKMAKAFGRAIMEPLKTKNAEEFRAVVDEAASKLDNGPRNAYREGVTEGYNDLGNTIQFEKKRKIPEIRKRMNELSDEATDKGLQEDFREGFDDAAERHGYNKWREESKDMPLNDDFGGSMHDVNREDAVQRVREEMIIDKQTMSAEDFFDKWFNR